MSAQLVKIDGRQFNSIQNYYGVGILDYVYTKDNRGNFISYLAAKYSGKRIEGLYIGHNYLINAGLKLRRA